MLPLPPLSSTPDQLEDRVLPDRRQQVAAGAEEQILLGCRPTRSPSRRRSAGRAPSDASLIGADGKRRIVAAVQVDVEAPDVAVEVADVGRADEPRIRRPGGDRIGLQRVLHLRAAIGRRHAVVVVFGQAVVGRGRLLAVEDRAVLGIDQVQRPARRRAARLRRLLRRAGEEARPGNDGVLAQVRLDLAHGRVRPGLANGLLVVGRRRPRRRRRCPRVTSNIEYARERPQERDAARRR